MDWPTVSAELQKKLDPKHVKPAPKGKFGDYIEGYHAITEANRIFGENGWSYTVSRLQLVSEQTVTLNGSKGPYEQYRVGYLCTVVVDVDGVKREGAAVGSGMGSPNSVADHHESAVKEAETDALKRALRTFGNPFGLALYDKTKEHIGVEFDAPAMRDRLKSALNGAKTVPLLEKLWGQDSTKAVFGKLPADMQADLQTTYTNRLGEMTPPDPVMQAPEGHQYQ